MRSVIDIKVGLLVEVLLAMEVKMIRIVVVLEVVVRRINK